MHRPVPIEFRTEAGEWRDPRSEGFVLVESWDEPESAAPVAELYRAGDRFCVWSEGYGLVRFQLDSDGIVAVAAPDAVPELFEQLVRQNWLPAIYPALGRQVLHASAALHLGSGLAVALSGPSHVGKSTIAYALGQREGWRQVADDVLAFVVDHAHQAVELVAIPDDRRLREPAAGHLGLMPEQPDPLEWPEGAIRLGSLVFLEQLPEDATTVEVERVGSAEAFTDLLAQAFSPSMQPRDLRERLVEDFLEFAAVVSFVRLRYPRRLEFLEPAVEAVTELVFE